MRACYKPQALRQSRQDSESFTKTRTSEMLDIGARRKNDETVWNAISLCGEIAIKLWSVERRRRGHVSVQAPSQFNQKATTLERSRGRRCVSSQDSTTVTEKQLSQAWLEMKNQGAILSRNLDEINWHFDLSFSICHDWKPWHTAAVNQSSFLHFYNFHYSGLWDEESISILYDFLENN